MGEGLSSSLWEGPGEGCREKPGNVGVPLSPRMA